MEVTSVKLAVCGQQQGRNIWRTISPVKKQSHLLIITQTDNRRFTSIASVAKGIKTQTIRGLAIKLIPNLGAHFPRPSANQPMAVHRCINHGSADLRSANGIARWHSLPKVGSEICRLLRIFWRAWVSVQLFPVLTYMVNSHQKTPHRQQQAYTLSNWLRIWGIKYAALNSTRTRRRGELNRIIPGRGFISSCATFMWRMFSLCPCTWHFLCRQT